MVNSTNMALPYCFTKIWNYATQYTELGCNSQAGYVVLDPNPDFPSGPANAPPQPSESDDEEPDPDTSGQNIDGNQNTQISGDHNIINYNGGDGGAQGGGASTFSYMDLHIGAALLLLILGFSL